MTNVAMSLMANEDQQTNEDQRNANFEAHGGFGGSETRRL